MAELIQKQDTLNQGREKLNDAITDAEIAKSTAGQAASTSNQARQIAQAAEDKADRTSVELSQAILEGDSGPLAGQLSVGADGTVYEGGPQERLIAENERIMEQRDLLDDWAFYKPLQLNREWKPIMSLVDDDGQKSVWTKLLPIAQQYDVPISIAVVTSLPEQNLPTHLNIEELSQLYKTGLFEIVSHTESHKNLAGLTKSQRETELLNSKLWLRKHGYEHNIIVYPYGGWNREVANDTRKYYAAGINIDNGNSLINNSPIDTYNIQRVYIDKGVANAKIKIDEAIANKSWIILGMHSWYGEDSSFPFNESDLIEIIQYAKSKGIDIVSLKKGMELYSNVIDLPNFKVGAGGESVGTIGLWERSLVSPNASLSDYPTNKIVYLELGVNSAKNYNMPEANSGKRGFVETYKFTDTGLYGYQRYILINSDVVYDRRWDFEKQQWQTWKSPDQAGNLSYTTSEITSETPLTDFTAGKFVVTRFSVPQAKSANMPEANGGKIGFLTTYKIDSTELYGYQEYRITNSPTTNPIYTRVWDYTNHVWFEWVLK